MFNLKKGEKMKKINVGDIVELTKRWDSADAFVKKGSRGIVISVSYTHLRAHET